MIKHETLTVSVPLGTKDKLKAQAEKEGRSLSNMVTVLLTEAVKKRKAA